MSSPHVPDFGSLLYTALYLSFKALPDIFHCYFYLVLLSQCGRSVRGYISDDVINFQS